jgi:iron-sulfur cluster assembly protein
MLSLIDVTEKAAHKAKDLLAKRGMPEGAIRVRVLAGGCSGMSYDLQPTDEPPQPGDKTVEAHGLKVYLDPKSLLYLAGTTLDYESTLISQRFKFINPNATHSCSCGESFAV